MPRHRASSACSLSLPAETPGIASADGWPCMRSTDCDTSWTEQDKLAALGRAALPVVVNMSFGHIAGPHDGSSMLERAIHELIAARRRVGGRLEVVVAAGNSLLLRPRCHASILSRAQQGGEGIAQGGRRDHRPGHRGRPRSPRRSRRRCIPRRTSRAAVWTWKPSRGRMRRCCTGGSSPTTRRQASWRSGRRRGRVCPTRGGGHDALGRPERADSSGRGAHLAV